MFSCLANPCSIATRPRLPLILKVHVYDYDLGASSEMPVLVPDNCTILMIMIRIIIDSNPP
jgi:hypothetical protein